MRLGEVLFDLAQPVGVLGLVFLRGPHAQRDGLGGAGSVLIATVGGATARSERNQHRNGSSKSDCLLPIDLH